MIMFTLFVLFSLVHRMNSQCSALSRFLKFDVLKIETEIKIENIHPYAVFNFLFSIIYCIPYAAYYLDT